MPPALYASPDAPPFRVAQLARPAEGGMRAQVRSLLAAFPRGLLAASPETGQFCADVVSSEDCFFLSPAKRPDRLVIQGWRAGKWAKARGANILHGHGLNYLPLFFAAQKASGLPLVFTLHNLVPENLYVFDFGFQLAVVQFLLRRVPRIVAVSEAVAQSAIDVLGPLPQMTIVRNSVDTAQFDGPPSAERESFRSLLDLPVDTPTVLCVARLSPEKGIDTLLRAVGIVRQSVPGVRIFIVGDGPQRKVLDEMAEAEGLAGVLPKIGTVTFLGARSDVADLFRDADVYVQPSLSEGLGLAVIEAMASGLPVVASRVGGLPEVIVDNETGLLVPPGDAPALANALTTLLHDANRREAMGRAGKERAVSQFGMARMTQEMEAVYRAALSKKHGGKSKGNA